MFSSISGVCVWNSLNYFLHMDAAYLLFVGCLPQIHLILASIPYHYRKTNSD